MTALCRGSFANDEHLQHSRRIFDAVGRTVIIDEKYMDAVTALSASGPAYIYIILNRSPKAPENRPAAPSRDGIGGASMAPRKWFWKPARTRRS
jgi:hypothetical protein